MRKNYGEKVGKTGEKAASVPQLRESRDAGGNRVESKRAGDGGAAAAEPSRGDVYAPPTKLKR